MAQTADKLGGVSRREQILDTATLLFAERGFHGVSVHDIGAACGVSGPALYKHFSGKEELLRASLVEISERLLSEGTARAANADGPTEALDALIDWHIDFALSHPAHIIIQEREWSTLGEIGRKEVRRLQLGYIDVWVSTLTQLRDDLEPAQARAAVQAVFGLLNSTPHSARIDTADMRVLLARLARGALLSH